MSAGFEDPSKGIQRESENLTPPKAVPSLSVSIVKVALNVIRKQEDGCNKYLLIQEAAEKRDGGKWYLAAGRVDPGETFQEGASREALEEAGIHIIVKGIIAFQDILRSANTGQQRIIFLCEQLGDEAPKSHADHHSMQAKWFTFDEVKVLGNQNKLRDNEVVKHISHVELEYPVAPIGIFKEYKIR